MAEPCKTCGTELFAGQRFCRSCGNPTDELDAGEAPTRNMPPTGEAPTRPMPELSNDWGARGLGNTAPQSRPNTNPVSRPPGVYQAPAPYPPQPVGYQPPPQVPMWQPPPYPLHPQSPSTSTGGRSGSAWAIVLAIFLALMLGAIIGGRALFHRIRDRVHIQPPTPPVATVPAADVKTFALSKGATISVKTLNGNIMVTGWDQPQAEVHIQASSGASPTAVTFRNDNNSLSIDAPPTGKVSFEIKLPRELGKAVFNATNGGITLSDVTGQLTIETTNGKIKLDGVSGIDRAATTNGGIEATLGASAKDRPMTFETANGGIDLTFEDDFNGTLDASAMHGGINVDDAFSGIKVEKSFPIGARASGTIGSGGPTVTVKTMNGGIKINK